MTCEDLLKALDEREPGEAIPEALRLHAEGCPDCALALRLELALQEAPDWSPRPALSAAARARVLSRTRSGRGFWGVIQGVFEESALTAGTLLLLIAAGVFVLPSVLRNTLKPQTLEAADRVLAPVLGPLSDLVSQFAPLAHQAWGVALLGLAGFALLFAAVFTARMMRLEARRAF